MSDTLFTMKDVVNKREIKAAKQFPHSKARQRCLEEAMNAIAGVLLVMLGELEATDEQALVAVESMKLLLEVLDGS